LKIYQTNRKSICLYCGADALTEYNFLKQQVPDPLLKTLELVLFLYQFSISYLLIFMIPTWTQPFIYCLINWPLSNMRFSLRPGAKSCCGFPKWDTRGVLFYECRWLAGL